MNDADECIHNIGRDIRQKSQFESRINLYFGVGFGSEPPSVEDDVDIWRYAIVSCTPETTITDRTSLISKIQNI